jgi:hypothetical protein
MGHTAGLDDVAKRKKSHYFSRRELNLGRPGRSQYLYRLSYRGSYSSLKTRYLLRIIFVIGFKTWKYVIRLKIKYHG